MSLIATSKHWSVEALDHGRSADLVVYEPRDHPKPELCAAGFFVKVAVATLTIPSSGLANACVFFATHDDLTVAELLSALEA